MTKNKKMVLSLFVFVLGGFNGNCFSAQTEYEQGIPTAPTAPSLSSRFATRPQMNTRDTQDMSNMSTRNTQEMNILPVTDESGRPVGTPTGRLDQVRAARSKWHVKSDELSEKQKQVFEQKKDQLERQKKKVKRNLEDKEDNLNRQKLRTKMNTVMEKIAAWNQSAVTQKAQSIYADENMSDQDKLRSLKRLVRFVNQEFDKLSYVKEPGKYTPAEIADQEEGAFNRALDHMEKSQGKRFSRSRNNVQRHSKGQHNGQYNSYDRNRYVHNRSIGRDISRNVGCESGNCGVR